MECSFCGKSCKSSISLTQHSVRCSKNPDRKIPFFAKCKPPMGGGWNKGLKGDPRCKLSEEAIRKSVAARSGSKCSEEHKEKIRAAIKKKVEDGTWHVSLAKKMHYQYAGESFHGTWEVEYAKHLDSIGVRWERCKKRFPYQFEGTERRYTPDFYLPDTDEYVEIKGFKTPKDEAKWSQFKGRLKVLMEEDLIKLGIPI